MSHDLMPFDADGMLEILAEKDLIVQAVNDFVATEQDKVAQDDEEMSPSKGIESIIRAIVERYDGSPLENGPFSMWPPQLMANGRHCTLNLAQGSDITNLTITFLGLAQASKLILIDPQGNNPLLTAPGGGGIFD